MQAGRNSKKLNLFSQAERNSKIALLRNMLLSRESDIREDILFRQGRGQFHVSSSGHEGLAAINDLLAEGDWIFSHYRDKALMLARGMSVHELALNFFAKTASESSGRQMVGHYCSRELNIAPAATPTGLNCLPAAGVAWALKKNAGQSIVFCMIGEASTRQGEFFESIAFAIQERLPIVFVVEDNGYGISTPTEEITPLALGMLPKEILVQVSGLSPIELQEGISSHVAEVRKGHGPKILWVKLDRLTSHTASDDQTKYRPASELLQLTDRDPVNVFTNNLLREQLITEEQLVAQRQDIKSHVKDIYTAVESMADVIKVDEYFNSGIHHSEYIGLDKIGVSQESWSMAQSFNYCLSRILAENDKALIFGEDVEDPKGGVFGLTRGLSKAYSGQVMNSPLAEATIAGLASGLSMAGYLPIFELQFIDFMGPALNQIINQVATLDWRSGGRYKCPMVLYAPCGGYVGGGPWHSQTGEGWLAHTPGLKICMPGNANDAAHMLYSAAQGTDPVVMLLPKNQFQRSVAVEREIRVHPERARINRYGQHVTIVAWGNCCEIAEEAADALCVQGIEVEIVNLCSLVPCDWRTIFSSLEKTGRLVVVQEDSKTCSFGQSIISEVCGNRRVWERLSSPPRLVSRPDVHIAFNRDLERAVLPSVSAIIASVRETLGAAI